MRRLLTLALAVLLTVAAATAWGYWSAGSVAGGSGAAAASSVDQGATPTATAAGQAVTVTWSATTLASGQAVTGYLVTRYDTGTLTAQTMLSACTVTIASTSCTESLVPSGSWRYSVTPLIGLNWRGAESLKSTPVLVDVVPPSNTVTLSSVTGGAAFLSGSTVYYRGTAPGAFRLTNAVSDAGSGPASSTTSSLSGISTGWTHTPSTVSAPAGGPYVSTSFDWAAGTTSGPGEVVTGRDVSGNQVTTSLSFVNDSTPPTTGTVSYADGFVAGRTLSIAFASGIDGGSGIATRQLKRAAAPLSNGTCGVYGGFVNLGPDTPASPYVDSSLGGSTCYRYRYVVTDKVGNQDIATSLSVAKVDYASAVSATPGLLSQWRLGEGPATLTSSDSFTGATGSALTTHTGELGAGWANYAEPGASSTEKIGSKGDAYRLGTGWSVNYTSATPPSTDYSVEADVVVRSVLAEDSVGVIGRLDTAGATYYGASWYAGTWYLGESSGGTPVSLATAPGTLAAGQTYRVRLEMSGASTTRLRLYVNGLLLTSYADTTAPFTAAGRAGIIDGLKTAGTADKGDLTGLHLENFQVTPATYPRAADNKGTNTGDYENGVTLGVAGALPGNANTAAQFDGVNDYVQMTDTTGLPVGAAVRSTELWFKTASSARQVLFRYGSGASTQEYGLWINTGGTTMTAWGWGGGNDKTFTMPTAVNNGGWHQVVQTYDGTSLTLYIDGLALPAQAAARGTVLDMYGFGIGAVLRPGDGNSGGFFTGAIDEVSFYTSVLGQATVSDHYQLGGAPAADLTGPTGGSVDASGLVGSGSRYSTSTTLTLNLAQGTDTSGVAPTGNQLLRATASLSNGTCGSFGGYALTTGGADPVSPTTDTVADQACYRYQYVVTDSAGNATTYQSGDVKVDATVPSAPSLAFSAFTNAFWSGSGTTVFFRSAAPTGSFTATATATDTGSGIASYSFPVLGANWTPTPGAVGVNTYSWTSAPAAAGTKSVTATNNATGTSSGSPFTLTADDAPPTGSSLTYSSASQTTKSVAVTFAAGTDAGSGIGARLLQRASAPLTGTTCGTYSTFSTVPGGTNPTSPFSDTVARGNCHMYQIVVADNVGNTATVAGANVVQVSSPYAATVGTTGGLVSYFHLGESSGSGLVDSKGTNSGTYFNTPSRVAGAIAGDPGTAMGFDGVNQYASVTRTIQDDFSIEFWFKSTQGIGTSTSWPQGAGLVDANTTGNNNDFGVSLRSDGVVVAGVGSASPAVDSQVFSSAGYNNGSWHLVVFTRSRSTGVFVLYVDGVSAGTATLNTGSLATTANITFGRMQSGGKFFQGALDEVALYDVVLSPTTVQAHYDDAR